MKYYLLPADTAAYDSVADIPPAAVEGKIVVKGIAFRTKPPRVELEPLAEKATREKRDDSALLANVLATLREPRAYSVGEVAKLLNLSTSDVSRAKAALIKAGKLSANSKKGMMEVKA